MTQPAESIESPAKITRNRLLQHALFWVISWYVLLNIFAGSSSFLPIDYLYTTIFTVTLTLPVYVNLLFLMPRYLRRGEYTAYTLSVVLILLAGTLFNHVLFSYLIDYLLPGYYFISYYSFADLLKFFFLFLFLTSLLKLAKEWIQLNKTREQMDLLEKEKLKAELQALINQVNPHFLFNSLTLIYSMALRGSEKTPEAIIKLSDILRYVIYESGSDRASLKSEIKIIEDYIHLQRYRTGSRVDINFRKEVRDEAQIAPMLLLQLLENSFKHGVQADPGKAFINMNLRADNGRIRFCIENNCDAIGHDRSAVAGETPGIGLKNMRERIRLTYHGNASLNVSEMAGIFRVELEIPEE